MLTLTAVEDRAIDWICSVAPERRRRFAFRLLYWTVPAHLLTHLGLEVLPERFFQHVIMLISYGALYYTLFDYIATTDVRTEL